MSDLFADPSLEDSIAAERATRLARRDDPLTSKAAAAVATRFKQSHADVITGVLWRAMIPPEIAKLTGLSIVQIDRRRKELLETGEIRLTGRERDGYQEWERMLPKCDRPASPPRAFFWLTESACTSRCKGE